MKHLKLNLCVLLCMCLFTNHSACNQQKDLFTKVDRIELEEIIIQFADLISKPFPTIDSIPSVIAYTNFIKNDTTAKNGQDFANLHLAGIGIEEIIKKYEIIKTLNVFNEIWVFTYPRNVKTRQIEDTSLVYNVNGKYYSYLKQLYAKNKRKFPMYDDLSKTAGGYMGPVLLLNFPSLCIRFYMHEKEYHLIAAIHYFTIIFNESARKNNLNL